MGNNLPSLLDPFAGGGAIPLEAQRLGLKAYAQDLNPVAVTINKAMIEIPATYNGMVPINPKSRGLVGMKCWEGNSGLTADIKYYGKKLCEEALKRLGDLYPKVTIPEAQGGGKGTAIAWIWARTVKCPNPACGCETPLVRSFDLSKKKGKEWHVEPNVHDGRVTFSVAKGKSKTGGTVNRQGATCICCGSTIGFPHIRTEGQKGRLDEKLMAVVVEGPRERLYVGPSQEQIDYAACARPEDTPSCELVGKAQVNVGNYGLRETADLYTNRQLTLLDTLIQIIKDMRSTIYQDACVSMDNDAALNYSNAITVYLALALDRIAMTDNSLARWNSTGQKIQHCFGRQAIPMVWDFAEANPFCNATGSLSAAVLYSYDALPYLPKNAEGTARQHDAQTSSGLENVIISTDPPYYDNIDYADLADFFYVWLRQVLRDVYPKLFGTIATPKSEELVASAFRDYGSSDARSHFEEGMQSVFQQANSSVRDDVPVTVYYAFKQSETETTNEVEATASTGWETMLSAIIKSGFAITGTWPMRTEMGTRLIASSSNALASSIVLVCRKRPADAPMATRREFVNTLKRELKPALDKLQTSNIAPVDMAQSAIGPGIGVYSRFSKVLEADGSEMTVRSALQIINQELDLYFSDQDSDLDRESRFCVGLYTQCAFNEIKFGEADVLARAKNTSIEGMADKGALSANKGIVRLLGRDELRAHIDNTFIWLFTQQLAHAMETGGIEGCAKLLKDVYDSRGENAKALAYRLFTIADKKGWNAEAFAYNSLVVAWPEIQSRAAQMQAETPVQGTLDFGDEEL